MTFIFFFLYFRALEQPAGNLCRCYCCDGDSGGRCNSRFSFREKIKALTNSCVIICQAEDYSCSHYSTVVTADIEVYGASDL